MMVGEHLAENQSLLQNGQPHNDCPVGFWNYYGPLTVKCWPSLSFLNGSILMSISLFGCMSDAVFGVCVGL